MYSYSFHLVFGRHQICIITLHYQSRNQEKKFGYCLTKDNPVLQSE
jgi:hypothetical protein